jgi:NadR type nicotinamide-nucleotide adenylyltransferase
MQLPKIISIIGPESTGKSTLAKDLADHFGEPWVPEYARSYIEKLNRPYTYEDLLAIAKGQIKVQSQLHPTAENYLICDTDLQVIKVWSLYKYKQLHPWVNENLHKHLPHLYLLTDIDLPWEEDPLREHPDPKTRKFLFDWYLELIQQTGIPYAIVSGSPTQRLIQSLKAISKML